MDSILNFIKPELLILVPVLYCVGLGLKRSKLSDRWIPLLLGAAGMGLSALYLLADGMAEASISAVCGLCASNHETDGQKRGQCIG